VTHDDTIPDKLPYLSADDMKLVGETMRMFPMRNVADHSDYASTLLPKAAEMPHEFGEFYDAIERHHVREYTRLFADRMAEIKPQPMVITGGSCVSDMIRRQVAKFADYEEAMILSLFHDIPPQAQPFNPTWEMNTLAGKSAGSIIMDDYDFAIDPEPDWLKQFKDWPCPRKTMPRPIFPDDPSHLIAYTGKAEAALKRCTPSKQGGTVHSTFTVPPSFNPPPHPVENRAARRAERAKKRKNHA
jgi:hypothetical protein